MSFLSYWEIFGIVLVTLYFILSLLFPKTKDSQKENRKQLVGNTKSTSTPSLEKDPKEASESPLKTVNQENDSSEIEKSCNNVYSHLNIDESIAGQQEVSTELHKRKSTPFKHGTVCSDGDNEVEVAFSSVEEASIEPLQANVSETPKLSELTDESFSFSKEPQESLQMKPDRDTRIANNEKPDNEMQKLDKYPSKYLLKESKNGGEGLPISGDVSIEPISDSTDKPSKESFSREVQANEVKQLHYEETKASNESGKNTLASEMSASTIPQNNNNLEKYADGLVSSTIETAVDNSVCLSNFAENLSDKIFWASADDVISEVHANIEKQKQELSVNNEDELKPIKLESLSCTVASEVVNEAVGEAALREEYKSDEETEVSPQRLQPHLGYVVENVVNNAICEAALKLKRDEDEDIDNADVLETIPDNDKSQSESRDVSENIAETTVIHSNNKDEQTSPNSTVNEYQHDSASDDFSSTTTSTNENAEDLHSFEDVQIINKEIEGHAFKKSHIEEENLTVETKYFTNECGYTLYEETESPKGQSAEAGKADSADYPSSRISVVDHDDSKHKETEDSKSQSAEPEEGGFITSQSSGISVVDHDITKHKETEDSKRQSAEPEEGGFITDQSSGIGVDDHDDSKHKETEDSKSQSAEPEEGGFITSQSSGISVVDHDDSKHKETEDSKSQSAEPEEGSFITSQSSGISVVDHDDSKHKETEDSKSQSAEREEGSFITSQSSGISVVDHDDSKHKETADLKSQSAEPEEGGFITSQSSGISVVDHEDSKHKETEDSKSQSAEPEDGGFITDQSSGISIVDHNDPKHQETEAPKSQSPEVEEINDNRLSKTVFESTDQIEEKETNQAKDELKPEEKKDFWRRSLILDLEQDFDLEESFSSDATSPDSQKPINLSQDRPGDYSDSEEDEVIDHDTDAKLGAVGGSNSAGQSFSEEDFDFYDYGSDDDIIVDKEAGDDDVAITNDASVGDDDDEEEDELFEPVLTVDGLCVSKQTEKHTKKRGNLKSVGSHYNRAIVLDNGCGYIKLGYAGDRVPRVTEQTVSGIPSRFSMQITGMGTNLRDFKKYGSEAVSKAGVMHLSHPMKAGMIDNWTDVEDIWEFLIYNQLGAEIGDNPIIMTEISQNPKKNREKITEILFEHFNAPAMYLADQLPLSIYASGLTSGLCLSSGYSCSQAAVVYEGHTLSYTLQHLDIGGGHLTENLKLLLRDNRGRNFTTSSGWQIVNDIKETVAFVAKDFNSEVQSFKTNDALTKYYTLPDGQVIDIGYECMSCVEPLFQPSELLSADVTTASQSPVHEMVNKAIKRCDVELQQMCHNHIILSGGTTLLKGFTSRLQHELHQINHSIRKIRAPDHRRYSPWIGGSILGSLSVFEDQYVTMDEYGDSGPRIVHKKCF